MHHNAEAILQFIDTAEYEQVWEQGASIFKRRYAQPVYWQQEMQRVRAPRGAVVSHSASSQQREISAITGMPDGQYQVFEYLTVFERKHPGPKREENSETVVLTLEDGEWKLAGYFVN